MRKNSRGLVTAIIVLSVILAALLLFSATMDGQQPAPTQPTGGSTASTTVPSTGSTSEPTTVPTTVPTQPPIVKESTATIGSVGDILMHGDVIKSGRLSDGTYNYDSIFTYFASYIRDLDYAVANMEGTLCGTDNGYSYGGYPNFNAPDAIAQALKDSGFDMLLTANNHSYDTRSVGFHRTQEVIAGLGLAHTGTVTSVEDDNFIVADVNGIQVGMICYTYSTGINATTGTISLNTIPLSAEDEPLINSFDYQDLDSFYQKLAGELNEMKLAGAEATVLFIHWGDEYRLQPNAIQKEMAQKLCDLGIDVIFGGHSHVVEPMELLTSTVDENHKTVCLYSMGNALSNQRQGLISSISTAHTEDGLMMSVTFAKYSDGTVIVEAVELLPTWVNMHYTDTAKIYPILPLDASLPDWQSAFGLTDSQLTKAQNSYDRTMAIVGEGLAQVQTWCADQQAAAEAALGIE